MSAPATLRVVIVDDEQPARDRVRRLLRDHADFVLVGEAGDVPSAVELIDRERPDLVFLDVHMPGGDGFEVLREARHAPQVVFTTAHDRYAVRAFEIHSIDYLLKPFRADRFAAALTRVRALLGSAGRSGEEIVRLLAAIRDGLPAASDAPERIPARRGTKIVLLDPAEVWWFEAEEALVFARTAEGRFLVDRTLAELEDALAATFFRTHRRYLVQVGRIGEIRAQDAGTWRIVMRDDGASSLPLSRRQARKLRERIPW
jgi:two-component system LytT family response regulator